MKKSTSDIIGNSLKQMAKNKKKSDIRKKYNVGQLDEQQEINVITSVCGITSIVCGIVGIFLWVVGLVGLIFGVVAIQNRNERMVPAIVGTVISTISIVWPLLAYWMILLVNS